MVVPTDWPPVTAETATAGATPRVPVISAYFDDRVLADGRVYRAELDKRDIGATPTQVGWRQRVHAFADGDGAGAVVRSRRSGREIVRYAGESRNVSVRSEGERLVDLRRQPRPRRQAVAAITSSIVRMIATVSSSGITGLSSSPASMQRATSSAS